MAAGTVTITAYFAASARAASVDVWDRVAQCESNSEWGINTGNGYYGGLQFAATTWQEFGGNQYASTADKASKEQQIEIAERVLAKQGPGAWPVCGVKAGLMKGDSAVFSSEQSLGSLESQASARHSGIFEASHSQASLPVQGGVVSTPYKQAGSWAAGFHTGVDFAVPVGTVVRTVVEGTVVAAGWQGAYGNAVVVYHPDGMYTLYAHLSTVSVSVGQGLTAGQQLGLSGNTGNSTGPHLHFEARTGDSYDAHTDPVAYLHSVGIFL
ncbi:transglycosylase family protein [Streptomyces sp. NPDC093595]|uniref:transglycosylase family protein n=1 Tax=Streptomyces sp. NPDC093595 TaxID=3366045 RepID=UPI0038237875